MKFTFLRLSTLCYLIMATSCNPDNPTPTPMPTPIVSELNCKINGVAIPTAIGGALLYERSLTLGVSWDNGSLVFGLNNVSITAPRTYTLATGADGAATYRTAASSAPLSSDSVATSNGTFTISKIDTVNKMISGTFSFTARNSTEMATFTEGVFKNIRYSKRIPPVPSNATISWKKDTTTFIPMDLNVIRSNLQDTVVIFAFASSTPPQGVYLYVPSKAPLGTYDIARIGANFSLRYQLGADTVLYLPKLGATSKITLVSRDTVNRKIKGTFYGVFAQSPTSPTVTLTDGQFEALY